MAQIEVISTGFVIRFYTNRALQPWEMVMFLFTVAACMGEFVMDKKFQILEAGDYILPV